LLELDLNFDLECNSTGPFQLVTRKTEMDNESNENNESNDNDLNDGVASTCTVSE